MSVVRAIDGGGLELQPRLPTPGSVAARPRWRPSVLRSRWVGWALVFGMLVVWELCARTWPSPNLPPVSALARHGLLALVDGTLPQAMGQTLARMASGYLLAALVGMLVGLLIGGSRFCRVLLEPLLELLRPVPISAFVPLLILLLGIGDVMKIWVAFTGALFPIVLNTQAGVASVPPTLRETAETFRLGVLQRVIEVTLPWAAPSIFVGLRLAMATALIVSVVAEMIAGNSGIGFYILQGQQTLAVQDMYIGIVTLGVVGYTLNACFVALERVLLHWHASASAAR